MPIAIIMPISMRVNFKLLFCNDLKFWAVFWVDASMSIPFNFTNTKIAFFFKRQILSGQPLKKNKKDECFKHRK